MSAAKTKDRECLLYTSFWEALQMENSSGPSCSKLTMSLVNDSLKFTSSDIQIC